MLTKFEFLIFFLIFFDVVCCSQKMGEEFSPSEIVNDLKTKQFGKVDEKFLKSGVDSPIISRVVTSTYADSEVNFGLLNEYARNSKNVEIRFRVLSALWSRMEAKNHVEPYRLLKLYQTIQAKVVNQPDVTAETKEKAEKLNRFKISPKIITSAAKHIESVLKKPDSDDDVEIRKIANALSDVDEGLLAKTMKLVVEETFYEGNAPWKKLIRIVFENRRIPQIIPVLEEIKSQYLSNNNKIDSSPLVISYYAKLLQQISDYEKSTTKIEKQRISRLRYRLPFSAVHLYFAQNVTFENVEHGAFLAVVSEPISSWFNKLLGRNKISLTASMNSSAASAKWHPNPASVMQFDFENREFPENYLTVEENRPSLKTKKAEKVNPIFEWRIDLFGEKVAFRNVEDDQLLCMQWRGDVADEVDRYEITLNVRHSSRECLWFVETDLVHELPYLY